MAYINRTMIREYDIRGLVSEDQLNKTSVFLIGKATASFLAKRKIKKVIVGYDSRQSSPWIKNRITQALIDSGFDIIDIGLSTVSMFYFAQYAFNCRGGIYVSGSHNPKQWNGFKIANDFSTTLLGEEMQEMYDLIVKEDFIKGKGKIVKANVDNQYLEDCLKNIIIRKKLKIVVDAGNATGGAFFPGFFRKAGVEVVELYCNLDPTFPNHDPNPSIPESKVKLAQTVKKTKADVGFAYDSDTDRLGVVDNLGRIIEADQYLALLAREVLRKKPETTIVYEVKCSQALDDDIRAHGGKPVMCKTGHSWVKAKMKEVNAELAGELSGHIFFKDHYGFDDGFYASLKLLEYLSNTKNKFSQELDGLPKYFSTPTLHIKCPDIEKYRVVNELTKEFKKEYKVIDINGARVMFNDGWGLVRASSNLPVLVLRFESRSKKGLHKIEEIFKEKLAKHPEVGKSWYNG
jgi:phosphomannomutase/phosphoglucomutase